LILHDDNIPITSDKLNALLKSANVPVQPYLPNFFARVLAKKNIDDFLLGAGGFAAGPSTATSAGQTTSAAPAEETKTTAPEAKKEEAKKPASTETKPESKEEKKEKKKLLKKKGLNNKTKTGAIKTKKFSIDCTEPVNDDIFDIASFEKFLRERVKVAGKAGVLGDSVVIQRDDKILNITAKLDRFSKRYLKYLTKKFLKKQMLRDYIRVIAKTKTGYFLKYFNFHQDAEYTEEAKAE